MRGNDELLVGRVILESLQIQYLLLERVNPTSVLSSLDRLQANLLDQQLSPFDVELAGASAIGWR